MQIRGKEPGKEFGRIDYGFRGWDAAPYIIIVKIQLHRIQPLSFVSTLLEPRGSSHPIRYLHGMFKPLAKKAVAVWLLRICTEVRV
jgi:hypothetical protein